jgi:hypothetical protein
VRAACISYQLPLEAELRKEIFVKNEENTGDASSLSSVSVLQRDAVKLGTNRDVGAFSGWSGALGRSEAFR